MTPIDTDVEKAVLPVWAWLIRKGLTYGITALAAVVGVREGVNLEWVVVASTVVGGLLSVGTGKLAAWLLAKVKNQ